MEMKEVYEKLEQMEGGAELITAIKSEVSKLNGEAKTNRENGDKSAAKIKAILENLGLEDGDDVLEKAKEVKSTLDTFRQGNKAPSEVAKQITDLTKQVASVTKQLTEMTKTAEDEKSKRYDARIFGPEVIGKHRVNVKYHFAPLSETKRATAQNDDAF